MQTDPIEEIRERRRKLMHEKYHDSVKELIEAGMKWEKEHPERVVNLRKQRHEQQMRLAG